MQPGMGMNSSGFQFLAGVLTSVVGNVLFSLGQVGVVNMARLFPGGRREDFSLDQVVQAYLSSYFLGDAEKNPPVDASAVALQSAMKSNIRRERISAFLGSPFAETVVRRVFLGSQRRDLLAVLREDFTQGCCGYIQAADNDPVDDRAIAQELFESLVGAIQKSLIERQDTKLAPHEALSELRHKILLEELRVLQDRIDKHLTDPVPSWNPLEIESFQQKLRGQIRLGCSTIHINRYDEVEDRDIDKVYVEPGFSFREPGRLQGTYVTSSALLSQTCRTVVLGDPGGGKSTFVQKLCFDLCKDDTKRIVGGRILTPILIAAREYARDRSDRRSSIVDHIASVIRSRYQIQKVDKRLLIHLLEHGYLLVIFDGLDEVLVRGYRQQVVESIESFCLEYPAAPVIATARLIGYEKAPLRSNFAVYQIAPFNNTQIRRYSTKYFQTLNGMIESERSSIEESFLDESQIALDLCSNPLMLSLICSLYRKPGDIPDNRPDLYKKCSDLMIRKWDKDRGILVDEPYDKLVQLLSHLAHWLFSNEELGGDATEPRIVEKIKEILYPKKISDEDDAERVAERVVEFCRDRAWVLTAIGSESDATQRYGFTHRTFLEYYTAVYYSRIARSGSALYEILSGKLDEPSWEVVAQIAIQRLDEAQEGAVDDFIVPICEAAVSGTEHLAQLRFLFGCLRHVVPSSAAIRLLVAHVVDLLMSDKDGFDNVVLAETIGSMAVSSPTNMKNIHSALVSLATEMNVTGDARRALLLIDLITCLSSAAGELASASVATLGHVSRSEYWSNTKKACVNVLVDSLKVDSDKSAYASVIQHVYGFAAVEALVEKHSGNVVFLPMKNRVLENAVPPLSLAAILLAPACGFSSLVAFTLGVQENRIVEIARQWGEHFSEQGISLSGGEEAKRASREAYGVIMQLIQNRSRVDNLGIRGHVCFAAWVMLASMVELHGDLALTNLLAASSTPAIAALGSAVLDRFGAHRFREPEPRQEHLELEPSALDLVRRWVHGEVEIVRGSTRLEGPVSSRSAPSRIFTSESPPDEKSLPKRCS